MLEAIQKIQNNDVSEKQDPNCVQIELDSSLAPTNSDIFLLVPLIQYPISNCKLHHFYSQSILKSSWCNVPIQISKKPQIRALFQDEGWINLKQFADEVRGPIAEKWLRNWLIQLAYKVFLEVNSITTLFQLNQPQKIVIFPQLNLKGIQVRQFWGMKSKLIDQCQIDISNPFRLRLTATVQNEKHYIKQISKLLNTIIFDQKLLQQQQQKLKLMSLEGLQTFYRTNRIQECSLGKIAKKLNFQKTNLKKMKANIQDQINLTAEQVNWVKMQAGIQQKTKLFCISRCSQYGFAPDVLWKDIAECQKDRKNLGLLLILTIKPQDKKEIRKLGFFSKVFPSKQAILKNPTGITQKDANLSSMLFNFDSKSVHQLVDAQFSLSYNPHLLLVIGKCDIVLSAYNLNNLCYFPVSYEADEDNLCVDADTLSGGKKFSLVEMEVINLKKE